MVLTPGEIIVPHPRGTPHTVYNHFVLSQLDGCDVTKYLMVGTTKLLNTVMHQIQPQIPTAEVEIPVLLEYFRALQPEVWFLVQQGHTPESQILGTFPSSLESDPAFNKLE
jgi:hypothetical protein